MMNSGVPAPHMDFWKAFSVDEFYDFYKELTATPANVIRMIKEPQTINTAQENAFGYLVRMLGNMKQDELCNFLRFVTGTCILIDYRYLQQFIRLLKEAHCPHLWIQA